jgi:succinate dehydrogenase / fumarate reductase iron-sulfur subunit
MEPFFAKYKSLKPFLINDEPVSEGERLQSPAARARYDDTTKCILCGACTTSCPSFWADPAYVGPAAIVNAHRFIFDDRDRAAAERLELLDGRDGVWKCRTVFNCVEACPRDIDITGAIADVKRALLFRKD